MNLMRKRKRNRTGRVLFHYAFHLPNTHANSDALLLLQLLILTILLKIYRRFWSCNALSSLRLLLHCICALFCR